MPQTELNFWLVRLQNNAEILVQGPHAALYQGLSAHHEWPVKNVIVDLPVSLKRDSKHIFGNSLSPLGPQSKDIWAALQRLLTGARLCLQ